MNWLPNFFYRRKMAADLSEEMRQHLDEKIEALIAGGMPREEAIHAARRAFGNSTLIEQRSREVWMWPFLESLWADIKFALRQLRKSPGFALTVILTLALGIGANAAIFSLVNAVLLRSLPVRNPDELVVMRWSAHTRPNHVWTNSHGDCASDISDDHSDCVVSYRMFQEIAGRKDLFSSAMAFAGPERMDLSGNGPASIAQGELVSGNYFQTLGVRAALGRTFTPEDDKPGAPAVAVLDYGYWQRAFGGATNVLGRTIHLNNVVFTIVGVADRGFTRLTPGTSLDLWVPLRQATPLGLAWASSTPDESAWWLTVVGRLRPGISREQAQAAMNVWFVNETTRGEKPHWKKTNDPHLSLLPAQSGLAGFRARFGEPLMLLMAAVGIILVIACANVAGLMLARGASREKEMAVRLAVGAAKRRVIRQLLTESLLLSFVGAALGTLVAYMGATGLAKFFLKNAYEPMQIDLHPNAPVLLFAIGIALLTGIGFGLAPAFRAAQADVVTELKGNSVITRHGNRPRLGLGSVLVIVQIALSVVVLSGAGLLLRTLDKLHRVDPGFDTRNLLLFQIEPELAGYKGQRTKDLYANLQRRLAALPGIKSVSYSSQALLDGSIWIQDMQVQGVDKDGVITQILSVGPDFFTTMKIPLIAGRMIRSQDLTGKPLAAIVNQAFVRKYIRGRNPIGLHIGGGDATDPQYVIVGVVRDTKYQNLQSADAPTAYVPLTKQGATFVLRTAARPAAFMPAVRQVVNQTDNNLPVIRMRTQSQTVDRILFNERLVARLFGLFGALGLALACIGVYGLLSYEVARRTREIGIRSALGAQRLDLLLLVVRQGLVLVLCGVAVGIGFAMGVTRLLASLLYDVRPTDVLTFCGVAAILISVGLIACYIPARRAASVDPMQALRAE